MKRIVKEGWFDHDTLTVRFGGDLSKPHNKFTAQAVKVPTFKWVYKEREDAGGGAYYNNWVTVEKVADSVYIILKEDEPIGWMIPAQRGHNVKSPLRSLEEKCTWKEVIEFANSLTPARHGNGVNL